MMGIAVQYFGGYSSGFVLGAAIDLIGVLAMLIVIGRSKTRDTAEPHSTAA
jgi:MFS transporter, ACS family, hexuronate transporter